MKKPEKAHGRLETRECWVITDPDYLSLLQGKDAWAGLKAIIKVKATRHHSEKEVYRYYISTLDKKAKFLLDSIRGHWGIENQLHWVLDVVSREDESRVRSKYNPENFAILRNCLKSTLHGSASHQLRQENRAGCDFLPFYGQKLIVLVRRTALKSLIKQFLRHIALNLLRREKTSKRSLKNKRFKCALSTQYLEEVLFGDKFHA